MMYHCREQAKSRNEPATALLHVVWNQVDPQLGRGSKRSSTQVFVLAKKHVPFTKYPAIHELDARHRVDLGTTYKTLQKPLHTILLKAREKRIKTA